LINYSEGNVGIRNIERHQRRAFAVRLQFNRADIARLQHIQYIVKLSRKSLTVLAAPDFTAHYHSMLDTKLFQAPHRHCKMPAPYPHDVTSPSPTLRFPKNVQLRARLSAVASAAVIIAPVELHDHCMIIARNWGKIRRRGVADTS
jgi:hypothetical protein